MTEAEEASRAERERILEHLYTATGTLVRLRRLAEKWRPAPADNPFISIHRLECADELERELDA